MLSKAPAIWYSGGGGGGDSQKKKLPKSVKKKIAQICEKKKKIMPKWVKKKLLDTHWKKKIIAVPAPYTYIVYMEKNILIVWHAKINIIPARSAKKKN